MRTECKKLTHSKSLVYKILEETVQSLVHKYAKPCTPSLLRRRATSCMHLFHLKEFSDGGCICLNPSSAGLLADGMTELMRQDVCLAPLNGPCRQPLTCSGTTGWLSLEQNRRVTRLFHDLLAEPAEGWSRSGLKLCLSAHTPGAAGLRCELMLLNLVQKTAVADFEISGCLAPVPTAPVQSFPHHLSFRLVP